MEFHIVKEVMPLEEYKLYVIFFSGEQRIYDIEPLFEKWEDFNALKYTRGLYELVKVDAKGYCVSWNDELDLACNELYYNSVPVEQEN